MKPLFVFASVCLAATSAGFAGFGGSSGFQQSNNGASSSGGGYSDQSSGGYNSGGNNGGGFGGQVGFGSFSSGGSGNSGVGNFGNSNQVSGQQNQQGGQVRRFVSVHVAPEESVSTQPRIIRAGGPADTHYNIIFVKAPSANNQQQTEVILPEQPTTKTLVYVLVKKNENNNDVKIKAPTPTSPAKPEVYFIRYKPDSDPTVGLAGGAGDLPGNSNNGGFGSANSAYGPPPQPNAPTSLGGYQ